MHLYSSFPTDILRHHSFFLRGLLKPFSGCRPQDVQFDDLSALSLIEGKNEIVNHYLWYIFSKLVFFGFTKYKKGATNRKTSDTPFMLHFLKCRIEILFVARYEILFVNLASKEVMNLLWVNFSCLFCNYIDDSELVMIE